MTQTTARRPLLAAALSLPLLSAQAEAPPENATLAFKYLDYQDSQPGANRVRVTAPAVSLMTPVGQAWSLSANHIVDSITGASPAYHTEALIRMHDQRRASDISMTHYSELTTATIGASYSAEADYVSRGLSVAGTLSTEDKNTTWNAGLNVLHDTIDPSNQIVSNERKNVLDLSLGWTQVLSTHDLAQLLFGYSRGRGYFSDPYKVFDQRPRTRNHGTLLLRWNHHLESSGGTSRLSYRYYQDSFAIHAHTLTAEYVQPLAGGWTLTPQLRLYSQSAADFYVEHDISSDPFPTNPPATASYYTEEQRLAAYGARTLGLTVSKKLGLWSVDLRGQHYEQRSNWSWFGSGSRNLAPFRARIVQFAVTRQF
jgi:hypothetical protein